MNRWGIPHELETMIRARDVLCVYCGVKLLHSAARGSSRKQVATWEHIVNDATIITRRNIARCCNSCNASKGAKELRKWLQTAYCNNKGITPDSVAQVVKDHLASTEKGDASLFLAIQINYRCSTSRRHDYAIKILCCWLLFLVLNPERNAYR